MTHFLITTSENNITRLNFTHSFRAITFIYCGATCSLSLKWFTQNMIIVGTSFVCLALGSRMGRIPEWPPQDSNPSPRLKDDKVALLVPDLGSNPGDVTPKGQINKWRPIPASPGGTADQGQTNKWRPNKWWLFSLLLCGSKYRVSLKLNEIWKAENGNLVCVKETAPLLVVMVQKRVTECLGQCIYTLGSSWVWELNHLRSLVLHRNISSDAFLKRLEDL